MHHLNPPQHFSHLTVSWQCGSDQLPHHRDPLRFPDHRLPHNNPEAQMRKTMHSPEGKYHLAPSPVL